MARYPGTQWHKPPTTFPEMTATVWNLRPQRTGSITEAIVAPVHRSEHDRTQVHCPRYDGVLRAQEHTSIFDYRKEGLCTDDHLGIAWVTTAAQWGYRVEKSYGSWHWCRQPAGREAQEQFAAASQE